jgi:hypothetical protein
MGELALELRSAPWFERVDVRGISDDSRRAILRRVKDKLGFNRALYA